MTDWLMVIITAIYVVATIIICVSNYKSANLSRKSNEINLISKIVEIEQFRLTETKDAIEQFIRNASFTFQVIDEYSQKKDDSLEFSSAIKVRSRINAINHSYQLFRRCILVDSNVSEYEYQRVLHCAQCFYKTSIDICEWMNQEYDDSESDENIKKRLEKVSEVQSHFFEAKEQYILSREERMTKALSGNLTLTEVKKMYGDSCSSSKQS